MSAVTADALVKTFESTVALDKVSFSVEQGELFGFIGPDGGGKTTLFRILVSLLKPDAGRANVLGLDVVPDYRALRLRVGYMAGRFSLYPDLSVEENLTFFASVKVGKQARVTLDAGESRQTLTGTVSWVSAQAEFTPTPIQTRDERADLVYAVKIRVPNESGTLKIGMPVDVEFAQ